MANKLDLDLINKIKKIVITSLVSDDDLYELLILKGGNAISLGYGLEDRASYDLDYSLEEDFPDRDQVASRIEELLVEGFALNGYICFDYEFIDRPKTQTQNFGFWGGYNILFKLVEEKKFKEINGDLSLARSKFALPLSQGGSPKFSIDISKFEYLGGHVVTREIDHIQYQLYAPELIVAEKIRALCQKLPEYTTDILQQSKPEKDRARARDFYDIYILTQYAPFDASSSSFKEVLGNVFDAKKVPHSYLKKIRTMKDIHRLDFEGLIDTLKDEEVKKNGFDFYFDYVLDLFENLLD
jgi:hypothetical protein